MNDLTLPKHRIGRAERIVFTGERRDFLGVELNFGEVSVTEQVMAFQRKRLGVDARKAGRESVVA